MLPSFSEVGEPYWTGRPTIVVGAGKSLTGFDFSRLKGLGYILAVKESIWDLPFADACFSLHMPWPRRREKELRALTVPLYLSYPPGMDEGQYEPVLPNAVYIKRGNEKIFSDDPGLIHAGANSGFGALNLTYLKRAKIIYLFGFDFNDAGHYCPERYQDEYKNGRFWENCGDNFLNVKHQLAAKGVTVINASPNSSIKAFPKVTIDEAIRLLEAKATSAMAMASNL